MKTLLVSLNSKYVHSNLAIRYLKGFSRDYDIDLFEATINEGPFDTGIKIASLRPDIAGFSCYIWNIEQTLKVCSILKEISPETKIILGGPEVSFDGAEMLKNNNFIDFVIEGEGEITFNEFLRTVSSGESFENVRSLIYRDKSEIIRNSPRERIENLDIIPFPYDGGIPDRIIYYEASRGCPFNCKYCLSSTIRGVRFFTIDRVKKDLKYFIDKDVKLVKFVDRTFNADKKFAMEIWSFLIENAGNTKFHFEIEADLLDDEVIELLKKAPENLFQFEIGIQTTNPEILKNINRTMDFQRVKTNIIKVLDGGNIHCHLDLIAGLPGEDISSFRNSFDMCMDIKMDVLQLGFLKILKGSPMAREAVKYGIRYARFSPYQVLYTNDVSFEEMQSLLRMEEVFEIYYNSGIFPITIYYLLEKSQSKFDFFMDFTSYLKEQGFFDKKTDLKGKFNLLYNYVADEDNLIKDLLIHDFIINTRKPLVPDFLRKKCDEDIKHLVKESKDKLNSIFGDFDYKRIFYIPVKYKVKIDGRKMKFQAEDALAVFNLKNGEFCYI